MVLSFRYGTRSSIMAGSPFARCDGNYVKKQKRVITMQQQEQQNLAIKPFSWSELSDSVKQADPKLFEIIESIQPNNDLKLYEATYQYGDLIYDDYQTFLPQKYGHSLPLDSDAIPQSIRDDLSYHPLPLSLITHNTTETFFASEDRIFSLAHQHAGGIMGAEKQLINNNPFSISAGARSFHLLPRITESVSHRRLKDYGVDIGPPKRPFDQWKIFHRITHSEAFETSWRCKVIFFSSQWMDKIYNDSKWQPLYTYLLQQAWDNSCHARNKLALDTLWEHFSRIMVNKRIKPRIYVLEMFKHLIHIFLGDLPGFAPACDNVTAPLDDLARVYLNHYGLRTYAPSFMKPAYFDLNNPNQDYLYYSLQLPTYLESVPRTRNPVSARADLLEFTNLREQFIYELETNPKLKAPFNLKEVLKQVELEYFHNTEDEYANIHPSSSMPNQDPRLMYMPEEFANENRVFCERGTFVRGCVRIGLKNNN